MGQRVIDASEINGFIATQSGSKTRLPNTWSDSTASISSPQNYVKSQSELRDLMKRGVQTSMELDTARARSQ